MSSLDEGGSTPLEGGKPTSSDGAPLDDSWLRALYAEVGREVSLAYSTLNQMKNFAIVTVGALVAAVASLTTASTLTDRAIYMTYAVGGVTAYLFVLRFFIRSMLCYNNLVKWNILQEHILRFKMDGNAETANALRYAIENYYLSWRAPQPRPKQIVSNLKLGFGLLFVLSLAVTVIGTVHSFNVPAIRALVVLFVGGTAIEVRDYLGSSFFDTPEVAKRRSSTESVFPRPTGRAEYVVWWLAILVLAIIVWLMSEPCGHACSH